MVMIDSLPKIRVGEEIESIIRKAAEKVLTMEGSEECEVSIFLTDDDEIHRLNRLYRDVDRPTDVLAFAMREGLDGELNRQILGDVVISVPTTERQAIIYGHTFEAEMALLVSHGVLHLLGYDHEEKNDILVLRHRQEEILRSLGYDLTGFGSDCGKPTDGSERQVIEA